MQLLKNSHFSIFGVAPASRKSLTLSSVFDVLSSRLGEDNNVSPIDKGIFPLDRRQYDAHCSLECLGAFLKPEVQVVKLRIPW